MVSYLSEAEVNKPSAHVRRLSSVHAAAVPVLYRSLPRRHPVSFQAAFANNNKLSENFDEAPIGTLVDSMRGNPDVIPLKVPLPVGFWAPICHTVPSTHRTSTTEINGNSICSAVFAGLTVLQTDRQTTLLCL